MTPPAGGLNAADQVFVALREEILVGQLRGGVAVREQEVAERLGVSRTPVREAVARLVAEGLLVKSGNQTAYVFQPSLAELLEIYEIRTPLESMAARIACEAGGASYIDRVRDTGRALSKAKPGSDWISKHEDFHLALFEGNQRPRLEALVRTLRTQSEPYVRFAVAVDHQLRERAQLDHLQFVELVEAGDAKSVEKLVRSHLKLTTKHVAAILNDYQ
jgi:DNA-binding GntR family transcriptional regulator